jgi:hypothetical protein
MFLNKIYYQTLFDKYKKINSLKTDFNDNTSLLSFKIIIEHINLKQNLHINFQNSESTLHKIAQHLFTELANHIYLYHPDLPPNFKIGQKLKRKRDNKYYTVSRITDNKYTLTEVPRKRADYLESTNTTIPGATYDSIAKNFVEVDAGISEKTISNYINFFKTLNNQKTDFLHTHFERKSVFIAPKTFYESLEVKNKIPTTYFPNPREEGNAHEIKSIPALPDSIMYFVPKYKVCYDKVLMKGKKITTVVVYDTEVTELEQIIQDKKRFGFNLIILTNSIEPIRFSQVPCWNWFKEETDLVNTL